MLPFSLGTVQRALSHLAERGAVVRRHGLGTFVTDNLTQLNELLHFRFLSSDGRGLLPVYTRVTDVVKTATDGPGQGSWMRKLSIFGSTAILTLTTNFVPFRVSTCQARVLPSC